MTCFVTLLIFCLGFRVCQRGMCAEERNIYRQKRVTERGYRKHNAQRDTSVLLMCGAKLLIPKRNLLIAFVQCTLSRVETHKGQALNYNDYYIPNDLHAPYLCHLHLKFALLVDRRIWARGGLFRFK